MLAPESDGLWREYIGGYSDWLTYRPQPKEQPKAIIQPKAIPKRTKPEKIKLTFKENKELNELPERLMNLEQTRDNLLEQMNEAGYFSRYTPEEIKANADKLEKLQIEIDQGYQRWEVRQVVVNHFLWQRQVPGLHVCVLHRKRYPDGYCRPD